MIGLPQASHDTPAAALVIVSRGIAKGGDERTTLRHKRMGGAEECSSVLTPVNEMGFQSFCEFSVWFCPMPNTIVANVNIDLRVEIS